jgi:hypothetical protein
MKIYALASLLLMVCSASCADQVVRYEPASVSLQGWLLTAYGEEVDGRDVAVPALQLTQPVTVQGVGADSPTQLNVVLMQMALDQKTMAKFKALKGKRVTVTGTLFPAHTRHHFTGVLVQPTSIVVVK